jgi:monoamine oxidase
VYRNTKSGKDTEVAADYVVVALPMNIVAGLDINLSSDVMDAVQAVTYSNSAKIALATKRRFWEEDDHIFGGHLYSDLPLGEFSYPSNDYFTRKGVLLGLYSNGPIADLIDRPIAARIEHVLTHAGKVHPQLREEFESGYAVFWKKVKYSEGGYASVRGQELKKRLATPDKRIILGSAAITLHSAADWQEGAISAGWQALTAVHERAMRG